ncbi:MAG: DUF1593 domain-containing protein [Bacteroides sp.]|nr:DUF1593 domain-containing protein [Bacteroides sp.]
MKTPTLLLLLTCAIAWGACSTKEDNQCKPRVLISTDIGGTDPDDNQSMAHLLMYSDRLEIEGLVSSPSFGNGSKEEILRMIDLYEKDYPKLSRHIEGLTPPDVLRPLCKQGRHGNFPFLGPQGATEGSEWIVQCARKESDRPLWVLVWGGLEDLAQALHDAPDIAPRIRVYWIGGPNKKWCVNSYHYIAANFPNLWMIENNASYRGFISDGKRQERHHALYYDECIAGAGHLGEDFIDYYKGVVKMGDTPSLLYLLHGEPDYPEGESWGGSFERITHSPRTLFERHTTLQDTVAVYSIIEYRLSGPCTDLESGTPCFTFCIDKQEWPGHYLGDGIYGVRYAAKAPATLTYTLSSDIPALDGCSGSIVISSVWPGKETSEGYALGCQWHTDRGDTLLYEGKWQGAKSVSRWREEVLDDWARRWEYLK